MIMYHSISIGLVLVVAAGPVFGQEFSARLAAVEARAAAKDWNGGWDLLTALEDEAHSNADLLALAAVMAKLGNDALSAREGKIALDAQSRALALRREAHEDRDHEDVAESLVGLGTVQQALRRYPAALASFQEAVALRRRMHPGDDSSVAEAIGREAFCLHRMGKVDLAIPRLKEVAELRSRLHQGRDHEECAIATYNYGYALWAARHHEEALTVFRSALAMARRLHPDDQHPDVPTILNGVGSALRDLNRVEEALPFFEQALAARRQVAAQDDGSMLVVDLQNLAGSLERLNRHEAALPHREEARDVLLRLGERVAAADLAAAHRDIGACLDAIGRHEAAAGAFKAELSLLEKVHAGKPHRSVAESWSALGISLMEGGDPAAGVDALRHALDVARRVAGYRPDERAARHHHSLAVALIANDDDRGALVVLEEELSIWRAMPPSKRERITDCLSLITSTLSRLGRLEEALEANAEILSTYESGGSASPAAVAKALHTRASVFSRMGRFEDARIALQREEALRANEDPSAEGRVLCNVAMITCLLSLGRFEDVIPRLKLAIETNRDRIPTRNAVNRAAEDAMEELQSLHEPKAALRILEGLLAATANRPECARLAALCQAHMGWLLMNMGRPAEALLRFEGAALAQASLAPGNDSLELANATHGVGLALRRLGRLPDALVAYESAHAMRQRIDGDADGLHRMTGIMAMSNCLEEMGESLRAIGYAEEALRIARKAAPNGSLVAACLNNLARPLESVGRREEALQLFLEALAIREKSLGGRDEQNLASILNNVGYCYGHLGMPEKALHHLGLALAMRRRLWEHEHPDIVESLLNTTHVLHEAGRFEEAATTCREAIAMVEQLRSSARVSSELRQVAFDHLKQGGGYELAQELAIRAGRNAEALETAERSRGRELLDLLETGHVDVQDLAVGQAVGQRDQAVLERLRALGERLQATADERDRILLEIGAAEGRRAADPETLAPGRAGLIERAKAVAARHRQLLDERARLVGDSVPAGSLPVAAELQAALGEGELLIEFTISESSFAYLFGRDGDILVQSLPNVTAALEKALPAAKPRVGGAPAQRGRDGEEAPGAAIGASQSLELFKALVPAEFWDRIRGSKRLFVAAHRELHRLPFEALVTDITNDRPTQWIDSGPPIAYVPSGSVLRWLRQRARASTEASSGLDFLGIGDPSGDALAMPLSDDGVVVESVEADGEGVRVGLRPFDVLLRLDGRPVRDALSQDAFKTPAHVEPVQPKENVILEIWRAGTTMRLEVHPGPLGVRLAEGPTREALRSWRGNIHVASRELAMDDLARVFELPPLRGAREEARSIAAAFVAKERKATVLLGAEATESAVTELAASARFLHFACHGLAEEYAGQSLSMLVLARQAKSGGDGFLKLEDLFEHWRGRLTGCKQVVLSACRTNVGPTQRDDAPQALPIGFLVAGAPSVISSLWAVNDLSTRELMTGFYERVLAGQSDRLTAFRDAKRALRAKYPDPFHWAPFLFLGLPD